MTRVQAFRWMAILATIATCNQSKEGDKSEIAVAKEAPSAGGPAASAAAAATPATPGSIAGTWACKFANKKKESVVETLTLEPEGSAAKANVTGVDGLGNRYTGTGRATFADGMWAMTFTWSNKATPTWVRVKPTTSGELNGRRGKLDDKNYEADYNCSKAT